MLTLDFLLSLFYSKPLSMATGIDDCDVVLTKLLLRSDLLDVLIRGGE